MCQAAAEAQARLTSQELFWRAQLRSQADGHDQVVRELREQVEQAQQAQQAQQVAQQVRQKGVQNCHFCDLHAT